MTAEEKAQELVGRYINLTPNTISHFHKQCALIAVDELIKLESDFDNYYPQYKYWQQVKEEITKL